MSFLILSLACQHPDDNPKRPPPTEQDSPVDTAPPLDTDPGVDTNKDTHTPPDDSGVIPGPSAYTGYWGPSRILISTPTSITVVDPSDASSHTISIAGLPQTVHLSCAGDSLWVLDWQADDKTEEFAHRINPNTYQVSSSWSLGTLYRGTNVIQEGSTFWFTSWGKSRLALATDAGLSGAYFDLQLQADSDRLPEVTGGILYDGKLYLTLVRLGQATGTWNGGMLVEVDPQAAALTRSLNLTGKYPSGNLVVTADGLWISHLSTFSGPNLTGDGGVEKVDVTSFTSAGMVLDDTGNDRYVDAAYLASSGAGIWRAYHHAEGGNNVQFWGFPAVNGLQQYILNAQIVGLGALGGDLWVGENRFDGSFVLAKRVSLDGTEQATVPFSERITGIQVCEEGTRP